VNAPHVFLGMVLKGSAEEAARATGARRRDEVGASGGRSQGQFRNQSFFLQELEHLPIELIRELKGRAMTALIECDEPAIGCARHGRCL